MNIAIAHEHIHEYGGGELVAEELAGIFDAPIYAGYVDEDVLDDDVETVDLFGDGIVGATFKYEPWLDYMIRDVRYYWGWERATELYDYDVIIQSGNSPGWYVPKDDQVIVKYVHTPPRTPYDLFEQRGGNFPARLYSQVARVLYGTTTPYPDIYVANSELVKRRVMKYWGIPEHKIEVVYPPVETDSYSRHKGDDQDYFLTFSRLYEEKRIDEIVKCFNGLDERLVVGGDGPGRDKLEKMAYENIEFVGFMSEEEKRRRLAEAKALIFNAENEDFGLIPIETFASGTPVIGVKEGFTQYQIQTGENGYTYDRGVMNMSQAVRTFLSDDVRMSPRQIEGFAEEFSRERFGAEMQSIVEQSVSDAEITPQFHYEEVVQ